MLVANDRDIVALGSVHQRKPEYPVESECAVEIAHPDTDVIDALDCDVLGHCDLHASSNLIWYLLRRGA